MPEFEITSPDGKKFIVTAPDGASEADILKYAQANMPKDAPSVGQSFARGLGLGARDVIEGVGQLPGMAYDALRAPGRAITAGINALAGTNIPAGYSSKDILTGAADAAGLPTPSTPGERIRSDVGQSVASLIPSMGAGAVMQGASNPAVARIGTALMQAPVSQVTGAAGSGAAGGVARENGFGPAAQIGAALAGGVTGAAVPTLAGMVGQGIAAGVQPFTNTGRQKIIGEALLRNSADPETLVTRLREGADDATRRLPGSPVTAGVAARDPQMMLLESGLRSDAQTVPGVMSPATALRDVDAQRNANRVAVAEGLMRGEGDAAARGATVREGLGFRTNPEAPGARQGMKALTDALYDAIPRDARFSVAPLTASLDDASRTIFGPGSGGMPAELKSVADDIAKLTRAAPSPGAPSPFMPGATMGRTPTSAAGTVDWETLQRLRSRVGDIAGRAARDGDNRTASVAGALVGKIDEIGGGPEWAAATAQRRMVGEALGRDASGTNATGRVMARDKFGSPMMPDERVPATVTATPASVRQTLGAMEKAVKDARAANLPQDQVRTMTLRLQDAKQAMRDQVVDDMLRASRTTSDIADAGGNVTRQLSPAQFRKWWEKNSGTVDQLFNGQERQTLERLAADFAESTLPNTVRARGSDTAQNLSVGNFIARLTNGVVDPQNPLAQSLGKMGPVANWIVGAPEQAMREMLVQAMRDPKFAAMLVENAGPKSLERAMTYWQKSMGDRVRDVATGALAREVPRALMATELRDK